MPLLVAVVGAISAIGVAFWNSRGESAELRQLKSLNEAIVSMPTQNQNTQALSAARDSVAARVAKRIIEAPARRRLAWVVVAVISAIAVIVGLIVLLSPFIPTWVTSSDFLSWVSVILGGLTAVGAMASGEIVMRTSAKRHSKEAERMSQLIERHRKSRSGPVAH